MPILHTDGLDIYYEITGKGSPLVLIHGLGSSTLDWERQVVFLSRHFQVITFDVRGHGRSGKPPGPYSVPLFASDAAKLIQALNIAPAHVAGISMGGMIAFQLAVDAPETVRSISIINSGPELVLRTLQEQILFFNRKLIVNFLGMRHMGQILAKNLFPEPRQKMMQKTLIKRWMENDKTAYLASLKAIIGWSVVSRISRIECPVLVVSADKDYTPLSYKKKYMAEIPNSKMIVIHNSKHLSPLDQPVQVNNALTSILTF